MADLKECCEHNKRVDSSGHFCACCGDKLSPNAEHLDRTPSQYQCEACCKSDTYRQINYGKAIKYCPNYGAEVAGGKLRDPASFMACR